MKKLIALLLVLCLTMGLVACSKPATDPTGNATGSNNSTEGGNNEETGGRTDLPDVTSPINTGDSDEPNSNDKYINPDFAGKTLEIWGVSGAVYEDIENMGNGSFLWMMRAAVADWAALNDVTVEFKGGYQENAVMSAINNGEKPDLLLACQKFPSIAINGIVREFTEEEAKQLSGICGERYLNTLTYKGDYYGVMFPWTGNDMFYYNKTMFENYGAKTPAEYYMEGNWTWDTMVECWKSVTKDLDGDGKNDTYGISRTSDVFDRYGGAPFVEDENGKLTTLLDTEQYRKVREIIYEGSVEQGYLAGNNVFCTVTSNPRPATHANDCEWYNFEHLYQTLANGDVVVAIPHPQYKQGDTESTQTSVTQLFMSIFSTCDENEATLSLMSYLLKVGMRYMSEFSVGLYDCEYEGIRGACDYSATWKEYFGEIVSDRRDAFAELEDFDNDLYKKMLEELFSKEIFFSRSYPGAEEIELPKNLSSLPPASAIPQIQAAYDAFCNTYNELYAE